MNLVESWCFHRLQSHLHRQIYLAYSLPTTRARTPVQISIALLSAYTGRGEHAFDRGAGGDLAEILPAQSIRHDKQPTVRLSLSRRGGLHIAKVVFVVPTGPSDIGKLGELHFQQGLALQST